MFQNYFTTAFRNIMKNRLFSVINVAGLAIGMAATILLLLYVRDEFSWDEHWHRGEDLYRLEMTWHYASRPDVPNARTVPPLQDLMAENFPEIETTSRFMPATVTIDREEELFTDSGFLVQPNFAGFFGLDIIQGDANVLQRDKSSILISETASHKYFADDNPVGQTLTIREVDQEFVVAGVFADLPERSHMAGDFIVPFDRKWFEGARWFTDDWQFAIWYTYLRFRPDTDIVAVEGRLPALIDAHMPRTATSSTEGAWDSSVTLDLMAVGDIHLEDPKTNQLRDPGELSTLYTFTGIAFLILGIAVINFLNLTMIRTSARMKEVGMRKVVGASARQIAAQFLGEAILLSLSSLLIALAIVEASLPWYSAFVDRPLTLNLVSQPENLAALVCLAVFVGMCAGGYHAVYFARLRPSEVLHSNKSGTTAGGGLRTVLVIAQFAISIALISGAFVITQQTRFARTLDLGFDPDNLLIVRGTNGNKSEAFKQALLGHPDVVAVGRSSDAPTEGSEDQIQMYPAGADGEPITLDALVIGPDFFKAYDVKVIAGRGPSMDFANDTIRSREVGEYRREGNIVINALAVPLLGFSSPEEALGQTIRADISGNVSTDATIVGVVQDFHFDSTRNIIRPGIYYVDFLRHSDMAVRFRGGDAARFLASIDGLWRDFFPDSVRRADNMRDMVTDQYEADSELALMLIIFAALAVFVSSLGIFGLSSFTAEKRTREIGIRKVLGASNGQIVRLLLAQFSKPVIVSIVIAWPVAWYLLSNWLTGFVYRIDLTVLPFVVSGLFALVVAWLTVSVHAFRVARTNPAHALACE